MNYVSIWSNENNESKELDELNKCNQWVPFTDSNNFRLSLEKIVLIGGSNNNLLFITYLYHNISVFDLSKFQFIKRNTLPTNNYIEYHCFVSKSANEQGQEKINTNKEKNNQNFQMFLFHKDTGLAIEYNENSNTFQFHKLPVCGDVASLFRYACVCINDVIFFFGGWNIIFNSKKKWKTFENVLPSPLENCPAILSEVTIIYTLLEEKLYKGNSINSHESKCMGCSAIGNDLFIYFLVVKLEINYIT
ncbi:hypothetical protein RFI_26495 [Reticulomyxa filosa]|uniref:Kelch motif family protein n=1 Tax=Reticulomyxa filosa TaxID=46433 RepID=X6MAM1_RETFI|nr:hypothetical protein RFI_26495 [Reticulomyxa filosa]|eukprot:ETO10884.1 hypothetical protein RFI_26495 [Reticulomyxa filosa]